MLRLELTDCQYGTGKLANGDKLLRLTDAKSGIIVDIPLTEEAAKDLSTKLAVPALTLAANLPEKVGA